MGRTGLAGALACAALAAACAAARPAAGDAAPASLERGSVYLYVAALPREADGLRVALERVAAVSDDGAPVPIALRAAVLEGGVPRRQRLLAAGSLPAGRYAGLSIAVAGATRQGASGRGALQVPPAPRLLDAPFAIADGRAEVLALRLAPGAVPDGVSFEPLFSVAPPGDLAPEATALATTGEDAALVAFHRLTGEVFDVLRTSAGPHGVAYDPMLRRAYVACGAADAVEVFDLLRGTREQSYPLLLGDRPAGLALARDGASVVVVNAGSNTVSVLDAPILAERFRVPVAPEPVSVVPAAEDGRVFVFSREGDRVSLLDVGRGVVLAALATENAPVHGALDGRGELLYVIHERSPYLTIVDVAELRVADRAYVGVGAAAIAVDPRSGRVYIARRGTRKIEVFDPASLLPIESIDAGDDATFLAIEADGDELLAAVPASREIRTYRLAGGRTTAVSELGGRPAWIAVAGLR